MLPKWIPRRFSLRWLLLAMILLACAFGWYGNRKRAIEREMKRLSGNWLIVELNSIDHTDRSLILGFVGDQSVVYPPGTMRGQIDFHLPDGKGGYETSRAIYRWEGGSIRFAQNNPGKSRPASFESHDCDSYFLARRVESK